MKKWIIVFISMLLIAAGIVYGPRLAKPIDPPRESLSAYQQLDRLSQDIYEMTKQEKYREAKDLIEELGVQFGKLKPPKGLPIESLNAITDTIVKAKRAFTAVKLQPQKLLWHALQLRLTIDSLTHEKQPLWKNYYNSYKEHISKMMLLAASRKKDEFAYAFTQNLQLYQTLKPALAVQASATDVEKLFSMYSFLIQEVRKPDYNWDAMVTVLQQLNILVDKLFIGKDEPAFAPGVYPDSPVLLITLLGSVLALSLGYAGWKKYKGEKYVIHRRKRDAP
ncbi:sporulation protein YpjB [Aneurinibacillus sp. Ricciae_BoGa-3]|uniref:sporulation protein YpjB n=1 Tax=Aneurinibacillus sp. Ricciae_BoGa-3 TaxID=3022697 RepID=UPI0023406875|nr:sporulation protein YpjB [Aneurinibacillus sp. Ricciae_BoGa-3]WCK56100.1 sporulation protein YpjB [Aneurinibacillus sp. Ricciae_BoGa-3]